MHQGLAMIFMGGWMMHCSFSRHLYDATNTDYYREEPWTLSRVSPLTPITFHISVPSFLPRCGLGMAYGSGYFKPTSSRSVTFLFCISLSFCFLFVLHGCSPSNTWVKDAFSWPSRTSSHLRRRATPKLDHEYLSNGLLKTNMNRKHPLLELINQAKIKQNAMIARWV